MYVHPESSSVADGLCLESFLLHTVALSNCLAVCVHPEEKYDSLDGAAGWAQQTLQERRIVT